jgi:hypothetical protein
MCVNVACAAHSTTASATAVNAQKTQAAEAIAAAEAVGAQEHPQASLHLKLAKDQLEDATSLVQEDDDEREKAVLLFERATADAELALLLTRQMDARQKAEKARQQVDSLSREN